MEVLPRSITAVRITSWAGVPNGHRHWNLQISDDRLHVQHSDASERNEACFISAPLEKGFRYTIELCVEKAGLNNGFFLGVTPDRRPDWGSLTGCFFHGRSGIWDFAFGRSRCIPCHYDPAVFAACFQGEAPFRIVADMRKGTLEAWSQRGELAVLHEEPRFLEEAGRLSF